LEQVKLDKYCKTWE